jgi:hypothetical protein
MRCNDRCGAGSGGLRGLVEIVFRIKETRFFDAATIFGRDQSNRDADRPQIASPRREGDI